jgi:hypothetical protein
VIHPGDILDGYRVIRRIGSGGFGSVWLCQSEAFADYRALKFIPASDREKMSREYAALCRYRRESGRLVNKALMPVEHANCREDGMYAVMPLADGIGAADPISADWIPLTLAALIEQRRRTRAWFSSHEVKALIAPVLLALQTLDDARLVHWDVKPENILFRNGSPCLSDISLLDGHGADRSLRGTAGYGAPGWYLDSGGHPDMYGIAATMFVLLTGKSPDKMGRSKHCWPPDGEESLSESEREAWRTAHGWIARATQDDSGSRFVSFSEFARSLNGRFTHEVPDSVCKEIQKMEAELENARWEFKQLQNEFERLATSTVRDLEGVRMGSSGGGAGGAEGLSAVADRLESGIKAARDTMRGLQIRSLIGRALHMGKTFSAVHGPEVCAGLQEFRGAQMKKVLDTAVSFLGAGWAKFERLPDGVDGLLGADGFSRGFAAVRGLLPAQFTDSKTVRDGAAPVLKIIELVRAFVEENPEAGIGPSL